MRRDVTVCPTWLTAATAAVALLPAGPATAQTQAAGASTECEVTSTFLGRWNGVDVRCGAEAEGSRAASVTVESLRGCPLLAGDRVAVGFVDDDPARQALVLDVATRGRGGASSGDWCTRGLPPGEFSGPCLLEEHPPRGEEVDSVGATSTRRQLTTWFRGTDDDRVSVSPGRCRPAPLGGGVYRIYIEESLRTSVHVPGPTYFADRRTIVRTEHETTRYEGGLFVDASLPTSDSIQDVSGLVRGWNGVGTTLPGGDETPADPDPAPMRVTTDRIRMTGRRVEPLRVTTDQIRMTGRRVEPLRVTTPTIRMTGTRPGG